MKRILQFILFIPLLTFSQIDLNVKSGATFYISENAYVVVSNGSVDIEATGQLIINSVSNTFGSLWISGNHTGDPAVYRRFTNIHTPSTTDNTDNDNDYISPPVSGGTFGDFFATNRPSGAGPAGVNDVLPYNSSQNYVLFANFDHSVPGNTGIGYNLFTPGADDAVTLDAGKGYFTGSRSGATDNTLDFSGQISTADVNITLTSVDPATNGAFTSNLIGNPFTTYVDATAFLTVLDGETSGDMANNGNISNDGVAIYYDDKQNAITSSISSWDVLTIPTAVGVKIAPGQGFFVQRNFNIPVGSNVIAFPQTSREKAIPGSADDFVVGRNSSSSQLIAASFDIQISNANSSHGSSVFFINSNKVGRGVDPGYDAAELSVPSLSISTRVVEDDYIGNPMTVQSLSAADLTSAGEDLEIPLHINAAAGDEYTISIANVELDSDNDIYLYDADNDSYTLLNEENYSFKPTTPLSGPGRFYIRTTIKESELPELPESNEEYFNKLTISSILGRNTILVNGLITTPTTLEVIDISGRLIDTFNLEVSSTSNEFDASQYLSGIYIARFKDANKLTKTEKLFIK